VLENLSLKKKVFSFFAVRSELRTLLFLAPEVMMS